MNVSDIRARFREDIEDQRFVRDKSGCFMLEIVGASFEADKPSIFGVLNHKFIEVEREWYMSLSLNVNDLSFCPAIWREIASPEGDINSNYGWAMMSAANGDQFGAVVKKLGADNSSRQAVAIYTRPTMHRDSIRNGMSDFMCTNTVQYLIRDDKLETIVQMRSNDAVFGYKNDFAWQEYMSRMIADTLSVAVGSTTWQVGSLHVYERHFDLMDAADVC